MQHISWEDAPDRCYVLGPYRSPVATVAPGETFTVATLDAFGGQVTSPDTLPSRVLAMPYVNPVTGPIYVEGAQRGDTLAVTIHDLQPTRDFGVSATIPEFGGLCGTFLTRTLNEPLPERVWVHPIGPEGIIFDPQLAIPPIPLEPFYGTIGTSPELEAISTLAPGFHGGNMDAPEMCPGNTAYFPVNVPGALLHLGDGHAAQGDGEVSGVAVEIPTQGDYHGRPDQGPGNRHAAGGKLRIPDGGRQRPANGRRRPNRLLRTGALVGERLRNRPAKRLPALLPGGQGQAGQHGGHPVHHCGQVPTAVPAAAAGVGGGGCRRPGH